MLFLVFGTLIRDFRLQHLATLLSWRARQQQLCSRWANAVSYDARRAAGRGPALWGVAGGMFAKPNILLEFFDASKGVLSGSNPRPRLTRCLCSLLARAARALRPTTECVGAGGTVYGLARIFFGAGAGAAAVATVLSIYLAETKW